MRAKVFGGGVDDRGREKNKPALGDGTFRYTGSDECLYHKAD